MAHRVDRQRAIVTAMPHDIVGRTDEFRRLHEFLSAEPHGTRVLVLEGEAGVGKSTLWSAAVDDARRRGLRVLVARPTKAEHGLAFAGIADLFDGVVDEVVASLSPPRRRAMEAALLLGEAEDRIDPRALGVAVRDALALLAGRQGTLVAIDDVQWLDGSSVDALVFALRRMTEPITLLLTRRAEAEVGSAEFEHAVAFSSLERLQVGPLSVGAIEALFDTHLHRSVTRPTLLRIHATSGGNPFYALELARALPADVDPAKPLPVPATLDELMTIRLHGLPRATRDGLAIVAAAGDPSWQLLLAAGVERDALEPAVTAGVLESHDQHVRFSHPLLASACYGHLRPTVRQNVHRRLAGLVRDPIERARHLAVSTQLPDAQVAAELDDAADAASARGAFAAMAELREHAVRLTPPEHADAADRRTILLARAHLSTANATRAAELLDDVLRRVGTGVRRAEALRELRALGRSGDDPTALLREALQEAGDDPTLQAQIHGDLGWDLRFEDDLVGASRHAEAALELAEQLGDANLVAGALATVASTRLHGGEGDALDFARRAYELAIATEDPRVRAEVAGTLVSTLMWTGHHELLRTLFEPLCTEQAERDELLARHAFWGLAGVEMVAGRFAAASELSRRALDLTILYGDDENVPASILPLARAEANRGHLDEARRLAAEGLPLAEHAIPWMVALYKGVLGSVALWDGDAVGACDHFAAAERSHAGRSREPSFARWRPDYVEALLAVGRHDDASAVLDSWERDAIRLDRIGVLATARRCRGLVAAARGDIVDAEQLLTGSAAELAEIGDPYGHARALLALGVVRRRARKKQAAREAIEQSLAIFEECGAAGWAARARAELGTIGGRRREVGLTAAERRVALLVAEGRTNREVAATLVVGERTVETHLSHAYAKLGVRSRTELARVLSSPP
jgi:DNA-binding CsgD family transcriptional regulator